MARLPCVAAMTYAGSCPVSFGDLALRPAKEILLRALSLHVKHGGRTMSNRTASARKVSPARHDVNSSLLGVNANLKALAIVAARPSSRATMLRGDMRKEGWRETMYANTHLGC